MSDLQFYKDFNDLLYKLDINITIYPNAICKFAKKISCKYKIKCNSKLYDKILDFAIKIEKDYKKTDFNRIQAKYIKEYQEMIDSLK